MTREYIPATPASESWPHGVEAPVDENGRVLDSSQYDRLIIPENARRAIEERDLTKYGAFLDEAQRIPRDVSDCQSLDWRRDLLARHFPSFGRNPRALKRRYTESQLIAIFERMKNEARSVLDRR